MKRKSIKVPDEIPFYGVVDAACMSVAKDRIKELLDLAKVPPVEAVGAMMHLELADNLMKVRGKTVRSILWMRAPKSVRANIWKQLLYLESQILYNLEQFAVWWDRFHYKYPDFPVTYPTPQCLFFEGIDSEARDRVSQRHQEMKQGEVNEAIRTLRVFIENMDDRAKQNPIQLSFDDVPRLDQEQR
ncbi:MAG: hypothetical protein WCA35_20910 [Kovacikia sp.]